MLCPKCGKELVDTAAFCTGCGTRIEKGDAAAVAVAVEEPKAAPAPAPAPTPAADFTAKLKKVLGSGLFLAIAILSTLNALMFAGVNIIADLTAIAMWMIYIAAKSDKHTCYAGLKFSGGILKAKLILNWICISVLAVILAALLIFLPIVSNAVKEAEKEFDKLMEDVFKEMPEDFDAEKELEKFLDKLYSDDDAVKALKEVEKELDVKLDRDSVEDLLEDIGYNRIEDGFEWMSDNREGMLTKMIETFNKVVLISYSVTLALYIIINVLVIGRLRKFARSAGVAVAENDVAKLNLTLLRSTLVTMGIFALAAPFAAAACFVGVALVGRIRREVIA